jgi:hypothetical protein
VRQPVNLLFLKNFGIAHWQCQNVPPLMVQNFVLMYQTLINRLLTGANNQGQRFPYLKTAKTIALMSFDTQNR